uniref:Uncharacterized protein n=1 Tax=Anguilla anguilla TaxID=7936 RepID=A0A0E9R0F7_ANGAN
MSLYNLICPFNSPAQTPICLNKTLCCVRPLTSTILP